MLGLFFLGVEEAGGYASGWAVPLALWGIAAGLGTGWLMGRTVVQLVLTVIVISVVVHDISATPLLDLYTGGAGSEPLSGLVSIKISANLSSIWKRAMRMLAFPVIAIGFSENLLVNWVTR